MFDLFQFDNTSEIVDDLLDKQTKTLLGLDAIIVKKFDRFSFVCSQEEPIENIYLILKGAVRIFYYYKNGKRIEMSTIEAPCWLGEMELLSNMEFYRSTVEALTPISYLVIDKKKYFNCLAEYPDFGKQAAKRMAQLLSSVLARSGLDMVYTNEGVLLKYFIDLLEENKGTPEFCLMNQTRLIISEKTGIAQRTLNRLIKNFQDKDWITIRRGKICLKQDSYSEMRAYLEQL